MDDFYDADVDPNLVLHSEILEDSVSKSDPSIFLKVSSILFVRAGLFLSQVSSIPSSNIQILIFQNVIDIAVNTVIYSLIGYLFAFGKDLGSFIGSDDFLSDKTDRNEFAEGWLIVIAVSGLLVAAIGDRISFFASLILNTLISGLVFPLFIHWVLSDSGWMRTQRFFGLKVAYKDYSYSSLIHMSGGFLAFISMLVLNKRLLRFKDMDVCSIPDNGPSLTLFGNFFMILGFFGIGIPTERYLISHLDYNFYGIVMVNLLVSSFAAVTSALLLTFVCPCEPLHKWTSMRSIQAGISGIAVIAGGADVYHPIAALAIGICNGILFFFTSIIVNISPIEDYSNITACHFISGFVGTLLPPIFGIRENLGMSVYSSFIHVTWQFICDLSILGLIIFIFTPISYFLDYCSILRSWDEDINHRRAMFAAKTIRNPRTRLTSKRHQLSQQQQSFSYLEPDAKFNEKTPEMEGSEPTQEKVNVLFEKKSFEGDAPKNETPTSTSFEKTEKISKTFFEGAPNFYNQKYFANYVLNSRPMTFFEVISDSQETNNIVVRDGGDNFSKTSKFFDIKLIKGIKNISDSKLFQKFKDNWTAPKKRTVWNREHEMRFGSVSNIWAPSAVRLSTETQV